MLPSEQHEYIGRALLDEVTLCRRRERTLLLTVVMTIVPALLASVWSTRDALALAPIADWVPVEVSPHALLPIGTLLLPLAIIGAILAMELLGGRRAWSLVLASIVTSGIGVALLFATGHPGDSLVFALAAVAGIVATTAIAGLLGRIGNGRAFALRYPLAAIAGAGAIGGTIVLASADLFFAPTLLPDAIAINTAAYVLAIALVAWIPVVLARRVMAMGLRVVPFRRLEVPLVDMDLDEEPVVEEAPVLLTKRRSPRGTPPPPLPTRMPRPATTGTTTAFTTAERQFFDEGDNPEAVA